MSTIVSCDGKTTTNTVNYDFEGVKIKIENYCKPKKTSSAFILLCLSLAKYDFHGAPSNWDAKYHHEEVIFKWAQYITNHEEEENYALLIEDYNTGYIPDIRLHDRLLLLALYSIGAELKMQRPKRPARVRLDLRR